MTKGIVSEWKAKIATYPLARRVLVAATTRVEGTWKAYIDAVPGIDHRREYGIVLERGDALSETIARVLFPQFAEIPYAS